MTSETWPGSTWNREQYAAVAGSPQISKQRVSAILDVLAETPGRQVSPAALAEAIDASPAALRQTFVLLSTWMGRTPALFPQGAPSNSWPFATAGEDDDVTYSMSPEQAEAWRAVTTVRGVTPTPRVPDPVRPTVHCTCGMAVPASGICDYCGTVTPARPAASAPR